MIKSNVPQYPYIDLPEIYRSSAWVIRSSTWVIRCLRNIYERLLDSSVSSTSGVNSHILLVELNPMESAILSTSIIDDRSSAASGLPAAPTPAEVLPGNPYKDVLPGSPSGNPYEDVSKVDISANTCSGNAIWNGQGDCRVAQQRHIGVPHFCLTYRAAASDTMGDGGAGASGATVAALLTAQDHPQAVDDKYAAANTNKPETIDGGILSVVQWTWQPFVKVKSRNMWGVNPIGVEWLVEKLKDIDNVEGPQGVTLAENLATEFMSHFKNFNVKTLLPPNASKSQLKTAEKVLKKIDNILWERNRKTSDPTDLFDLLFQQVRKVITQDCWARGDPLYKNKEMERMIKNEWTVGMDRQKTFPIQMQSCRELWDELPDEEKQKWEIEAAKQKEVNPGRAELLAAMLEVFASVGDAWVAHTGWFFEVRTMGIGEDGLPHDYIKKFHPIVVSKIGDYSKLPASEAYDMSMQKAVAEMGRVKPEDVKIIPPWKTKVYMPKRCGGPLVRLEGTVKVDDKGCVEGSEDALREAMINYMNMTFALCHVSRDGKKGCPKKPNWNRMWLLGMENYVDPKVLPPSPFVFDNPEHLKEANLKTLAQWILKGERGELDTSNCFQWIGQQAGAAIGVRRVGPVEDGTKLTLESPKWTLEDGELEPKRKKQKIKTTPEGSARPQPTMVEGDNDDKKTGGSKTNGAKGSQKVTRQRVGSRWDKNQLDTEDDNASEALVVKGPQGTMFGGDMSLWLFNFAQQCDLLNWEDSVVEGPMGSPVPLSARFIDGMEVQEPSILGGLLDITQPKSSLPEQVAKVIEYILLPSKPLPQPSIVQMQGGKHAQHVFELLLKCANEVLVAIVTYATDGERPVLRVSGKLGLFPGLRAVEFLRRSVHTADKGTEKMAVICSLLDHYDSTLTKEAWRRWAIISFVQSKHDKAGLLFKAWLVWMETVMRVEVTEDQLSVPAKEQWATPKIKKEVQAWVKHEASLDMTNASVLDVFLWTYSLFMISGHGGESESAWCKKAIQKTIQELLDASKQAEPNILDNRKEIIGDAVAKLKGQRWTTKKDKEVQLADASVALVAVPTEKVIRATRNLQKPASQKPESQGVRSSEHLSDKEVVKKMDQKKSAMGDRLKSKVDLCSLILRITLDFITISTYVNNETNGATASWWLGRTASVATEFIALVMLPVGDEWCYSIPVARTYCYSVATAFIQLANCLMDSFTSTTAPLGVSSRLHIDVSRLCYSFLRHSYICDTAFTGDTLGNLH
ncbi:hypothetical protein M422DRAFT_50147 [Sphaerobolus stellatus SS14]|uniref:Uncharacterized protein n=1 Tax=Sphaerobolus stellatus (strain SS14) TaxID=990650 RepID=A0A0C9VKT7_SPHS4|nr:hypothetical protein M422DRAFT_50147 [Sphaerobolus stellatus SS14]